MAAMTGGCHTIDGMPVFRRSASSEMMLFSSERHLKIGKSFEKNYCEFNSLSLALSRQSIECRRASSHANRTRSLADFHDPPGLLLILIICFFDDYLRTTMINLMAF